MPASRCWNWPAQYGSGEPVRIRKIAERHDVPPRFLVQILLQLKGAGMVASVRGAAGGYQLLKSPEEVSLGQVMEVIEGAGDENGQTSSASPDSAAVKVLQNAWHEVSLMQRKMLDGMTLADLLEAGQGPGRADVSYLRGIRDWGLGIRVVPEPSVPSLIPNPQSLIPF